MNIIVQIPASTDKCFEDICYWSVDGSRILTVFKKDDDGSYEVASFKEWNHVVVL